MFWSILGRSDLATARLNQISVVFSEDFNPGWITEGVRFVNPFAADFQIETWLSR